MLLFAAGTVSNGEIWFPMTARTEPRCVGMIAVRAALAKTLRAISFDLTIYDG